MNSRAMAMRFVIALVLAGWMRPVHGDPPAQASYHVNPIIKIGDTVDGQVISPKRIFFFAGFSDLGQLVLNPWTPDGSEGDLFIQYLNGQFTTILAPGGPAPDGAWPTLVAVLYQEMNSHGVEAFTVADGGTGDWLGTYQWDPGTGKTSVIAREGMPAAAGYSTAGPPGLAINNNGDILMSLSVTDTDGKMGTGLFLLGHDGTWQPILVPGQVLPNGKKLLEEAFRPSALDDAGDVLFEARGSGQTARSLFLWEQGKASLVLAPGAHVPDGNPISQIGSIGFRNVNHEIVVAATVGQSTVEGIYRVVDGKPIPVAVPGQPMPGGGVFDSLRWVGSINNDLPFTNGLGAANLKGEIPFLATLGDGTPVLYVFEPDGTLTPVLRQGQVTNAGTITRLGMAGPSGTYSVAEIPVPAINDNGEIVVPLEIDNGPRSVAILTPPAP